MATATDRSDGTFRNELTLLERRDINIERNRSFFLSLFGSSSSVIANSANGEEGRNEDEIGVSNGVRKVLDLQLREEEIRREDIVISLSSYFLHRRDLIHKLAGYLNPVS